MKAPPIIVIRVESTADVVLVRQRAQALAEIAGFDSIKQTSFATALSEISRNALQFAKGARVEYSVESHGSKRYLAAEVTDRGPGIAEVIANGGSWDRNITFHGHGIASARKLVKMFSIYCPESGGCSVRLGIPFDQEISVAADAVPKWTAELMRQQPRSMLEEMQHRNQELMVALDSLRIKEIELERQMVEEQILKLALAESRELLEARVIERTQSLVISNEELRAFSYTVSHDLRAPLRAINGFIQMLLDDHVRPEDTGAADLTRSILGASSRMDALIQDLVAYTQVSRVPIPVKPVDCRKLIEELLAQCEVRLRPQKVKVETSGDFPNVTANHAILESALTNLFDNAVKFRKPATEAAIRFRGAPNGKNLRLWVEDNGIGIAPEHHERIFRVFERLHGYEVPGTGIGLAMVRRWISGMQGAVGVESKLGEGSRFWIDLPLSRADERFSS
jgi:signal transduction histidine kinase